jgi:polysaccharide deacetylase 2 family uncharacterized protein YibQ
MLSKIPLKFLIRAAIFLFAVLIATGIFKTLKKKEDIMSTQEVASEGSISNALLLNTNLKKTLNVYKEITLRQARADTITANEIWLVPNGMSIPNYMLLASREIEKSNGKVLWMREIKEGRALLKYEGEQGVYPLAEIRIVDSIWLPNSSKLAVILAVKEQNKILKSNPELLDKLNFTYSLLVPSSRPELLDAAKKINANIIPWIPMESSEFMYGTEKKNQIPLGITNEKELAAILDDRLKNFENVSGFASLYGKDFFVHPASVDIFGNVLRSKKLWFLDLTARGTASLSPNECAKKELKCNKSHLEAESEAQIRSALKTARIRGSAVLVFALTEASINLLENLPDLAAKQGTTLTAAEDAFK